MMNHRVIMTRSGLMISSYYMMERICLPKPSAKELIEARNRKNTYDQQQQRAKHFGRSKFVC